MIGRGTSSALRPSEAADSHICCLFADLDGLSAPAAEFLRQGGEMGLQLGYVGPGPVGQLRSRLAHLAGADEMISAGALRLLQLQEVYAGAPVSAREVIGTWDSLVSEAIDSGYRGFRVVAEATELVTTGGGLDAFARYEVEVGTYIEGHPFSAMCALATDIGADPMVDLASVHSGVICSGPAPSVPFCMTLDPYGVAHLSGNIDLSAGRSFARTAARVLDLLDEGPSVIDMSEVRFIDHRALSALDRAAEERDRRIVITGAPATAHRLLGLMPMARLSLADGS